MDRLLNDIIYAIKRLGAKPVTTAAIVLTMAFGIGANTAIFSLVNGVMFEPLPFKDSDNMIILRHKGEKEGRGNMGYSVAEVVDFREQFSGLSELVEYHAMRFYFLDENPAVVSTGVVSYNYFDFLGISPIIGRNFTPEDEAIGSEPVLLLSYEFWQRHYGGDPNIVGTVVEMNDKSNRIIGVLPVFPQFPQVNDIYVPVSGCPTRSSEMFINNRESRMMSLYGRLSQDVTFEMAKSELDVVSNRMYSQYPNAYSEKTGFKTELLSLTEESSRRIQGPAIILMATTLLILILTCTNVINITLADYAKRTKELAIRSALGADKKVIVQQLMTEGILLTLTGALAGLVVAFFSIDWLRDFAVEFTPRAMQIQLDGPVLLFTLVIAVLTGIIVGVAPTIGKENILDVLKEGGSHATANGNKVAARKLLLVGQVAISFVLLVAAGLMIRSFLIKQDSDPGFDPSNIVAVSVPLNWSKYDKDAIRNFSSEVTTKLKSVTGVESVALTTAYPFGNTSGSSRGITRVIFNDRDQQGHERGDRVSLRAIDENYFKTLSIRIKQGRDFNISDASDAPPVAIISQSFADKYWPDDNPVSRVFSVDGGESWITVVGVVPDVLQTDLDATEQQLTEFYVPIAQFPRRHLNILVKTSMPLETLKEQVKQAVESIDHQQPISKITTIEDAIAETLSSSKLIFILLSIFSVLALFITTLGLSGLLAYSVNQRTRELGIRMALGATSESIQALVLKEGGILVITGLITGVVGSYFVGRLLEALIYGIPQTDWVTYSAVSLVLLGVALIACWLPALKASRLNPNAALRAI